MSDQTSEPMSDERLAEIRAMLERVRAQVQAAMSPPPSIVDVRNPEPDAASAVPISTVFMAMHTLELLHEVERLRAREAPMREMLQKLIRDADASYVEVHPYAGVGHTTVVGPFSVTVEQARAWLAGEASEEGGGDGR